MKTTKLLRSILTCVLLSFAASCTEEEKEPPVDGTVTDENGPITLELADLTATTALFKGSVNLNLYSKYDEVGIIYSLTEDLEIKPLVTNVVPITNIDKNNRFEKTTHELRYNTKYYYSSYTCMNGIYKFGEVQSFTTDDVKIEVSAPTVTSTTATFTGKVTVEEVDLESLYFGVAWSAGNDFKKDVNEEDVELDDDGSFVLTVEGLKMEKEYYYAPYICQSDSKYGDMKTFITTAASMSVSASQITQTSVTFTGKAEKNSADESIEYGILYSTDSKLEIGASGCVRKILTDMMSANGNYSLKVDGLINDTKYYYCWYARQGSDYKYGPLQEFSTTSITVNISVNPITETTATFTGSYTRPDGDDIEVGLLCSSSSASLTYANATKIKLSDENFTHKITGLNYNTSYYYCSYICQNGKYKYGPVESFKTKDVTVEVSASDITMTSVTFNGKTEFIDSDVIEVGILYSTYSSLSPTTSSTNKKVLNNGDFSFTAQDLKNNTKYYYKYYIKYAGSYAYGERYNFTTGAIAATLSEPSVTQTTATFSGNVNIEDISLIQFGILYSTSSSLSATSSNVKKIPVTSLNDGAFSCKAEGLTHSKTYYYCYYACQDGSYTYGNTESFTTSSVKIDLSVGSVTPTTAVFNGNVELTEDGLIEVGVLYSTQSSLNYLGASKRTLTPDSSGKLSYKAEDLQFERTYYYCYYICQDGKYTYGPSQSFFTETSVKVSLSVESTTPTTATFSGNAELTEEGTIEVGVICSTGSYLGVEYLGVSKQTLSPDSSGAVLGTISGLQYATTYNYCYYICHNGKYTYGETQTFTTSSVNMDLSVDSVTPTTAVFNGNVELTEEGLIEVGVLYSTGTTLTAGASGVTKQVLTPDSSGLVSFKAEGLLVATTYNYCYYVCQNGKYAYGVSQMFTTSFINMNLLVDSVTQTTASFNGTVEFIEDALIEVGILYSTGNDLTIGTRGVSKYVLTYEPSGLVSFKVEGLQFATTYNYCYYVCQNGKYTYGTLQTFITSSVNMTLSVDSVTQSTATFNGKVELTEEGLIEVGVLYSTGTTLTAGASGVTKQVLTYDSSGSVSYKAEGLLFAQTYNYCYYACQNGKYTYGTPQTFTTSSVNMDLSVDSVTQTTATFNGKVELTEEGLIEVGVLYSTGTTLTVGASGVTKQVLTPNSLGSVSYKAEGLQVARTYNYCYYVCQNGKYAYGTPQTFTTSDFPWDYVEDLSINGIANSYIVSKSGCYKIKAVRGNCDESVGAIEIAEVLWESFGTSVTPSVGDLVQYVSCKDGYLSFKIHDDFKEGNAVIAAKDANGKILWSWHIWLTDQPQEHVYYNNAGTMMDRNLGATSATPGDGGVWGLLYQWGRKDPFLGYGGSIYLDEAKSTNAWKSPVESTLLTGTIEYATTNPTTFITSNSSNRDWYYTGSSTTDNTRWTTSEKTKSIYDPCPAGWRVPDGGGNGVWSMALGSSSPYDGIYDKVNRGINFSSKFGDSQIIWYPSSGYRDYYGDLWSSTNSYWSASSYGSKTYYASNLYFNSKGGVYPSDSGGRAYGYSVRCIKE